ncbi:MAG: ArgR family transcriptional regulator [Dysgonamonadaceae bacterium]|jgi:transcriptional regulator of arginine metabolism|nr:ArgR family transcriptional regulator [Dysgonamonadaceae bacterium]
MDIKKERHIAIRRAVKNHSISSQEELKNILEKDGFTFAQATLSRDIKELKIVKYPDVNGDYIYTFHGENNYSSELNSSADENEISSRATSSLEFSGGLAILKTRPGYAMGIASDIDSLASEEILGTIAGDDTILLIPREGISRKAVIDVLQNIILNLKYEI